MFKPDGTPPYKVTHALMTWLTPDSETQPEESPSLSPVAEQATYIEIETRSDAETSQDSLTVSSPDVERVIEQNTPDVGAEQNSRIQGRLPIVAGVLFLACAILLVRRRPGSTGVAIAQLIKLYERARLLCCRRPESRPSTMQSTKQAEHNVCTQDRISLHSKVGMMLAIFCCVMTGCASLTNPVLNGIPVRRLPTDLLSSPRRERLQTIPLSLLRQ